MSDRQAPSTFLDGDALPQDCPPALAALWWAHRGRWEPAHALVQDGDGPDAAWVHAHLHRLEGDMANASYWYRRARRPIASGDLVQERLSMAATLLTDRDAR